MAQQHPPRFLKIVEDAKQRVRETNVDEVKARLDRGEKFILVDVREDREFDADHLPGAVHLGKGIIERDVEGKYPDLDTPTRPLLWRRIPFRAGSRQSAKNGIHQRHLDGWRNPRLARKGLPAGEVVANRASQVSEWNV